MCAAVLGFQCVVLGLVTPVLITVESISTGAALAIGLGLAVAALAIAGSLRFEVMYVLGFVLQGAALALGFVVPVMFVLGLIFGALWTTAYVLGRKIEREQAARLPL
jgi:cbb3-type cytochrome oxidase subunit 3